MCSDFELKPAGKEGIFRAIDEEEAHRSPKTRAQAAMEIERDLEVHSVVTENLHDTTVHGGQKVTDEHGHKKFLPYKTVAAGGHGTEVVSNFANQSWDTPYQIQTYLQWGFHFAESGNWKETFVPVHGDGQETPPIAQAHQPVLGVRRTRHH